MPVDHYENFPVASFLLPKHLRQPIEAIYRFARSADDIADEGNAGANERLADLAADNAQLDRIESKKLVEGPSSAPLASEIAEWQLPIQLFRDLLDAFSQDVVKPRYASYEEVLRRPSAFRQPGRPAAAAPRSDCATPENLRRSDAICSALQMANFWQDVAIDWKKDRVYLPQDDLPPFRHQRISDRRRSS